MLWANVFVRKIGIIGNKDLFLLSFSLCIFRQIILKLLHASFSNLALCILTDFPIYIATISMGLPNVYFNRSQVEFSKL